MHKLLASLSLATVLGLGVALTPFADAHAALNAYLKLKGEKSGDIKGAVTLPGREGTIRVIAVSHDVIVPHDPATGLASGKRQHKPFVVTVEVDKAMPILYGAISSNETLTQFALKFYAPGAKDTDVLTHTVKMTKARLVAVKLMSPAPDAPANAKERLQLSFTYQKIEWTWAQGNIMTEDDWKT